VPPQFLLQSTADGITGAVIPFGTLPPNDTQPDEGSAIGSKEGDADRRHAPCPFVHEVQRMWCILIVDGVPKYRKLLRGLFERAGHEVAEAAGGGSVVGLAQAERPQVVLLDVDLPDMRGIAVYRRLRSNPNTASIPVAIVTSHGDEDTRVVNGLVRRLREKLGSAADYIQTVRGVGDRLDAGGS
jgi:DNA-binding response OmpR family regulator